LKSSPKHVLIVHGDSQGVVCGAEGAVVVLCSCYLSWICEVIHPKEGMFKVCATLGLPEHSVWPSHRRYLSYFELLQHRHGEVVSPHPVILEKVTIVGDTCAQPRILEVLHLGHCLYRAYETDAGVMGAVFKMGLKCYGDLSVHVLHCSGKQEVVEAQVCFHTGFVDIGVCRFPGHEVDQPTCALPADYCIDIFLEPVVDSRWVEIETICETAPTAVLTAFAREPSIIDGNPGSFEAIHNHPSSVQATAPGKSTACISTNFFDLTASTSFFDLTASDEQNDIDAFFADLA